MIVLVLGLWTFLRALVVGAAAVSLENVALRSQLARAAAIGPPPQGLPPGSTLLGLALTPLDRLAVDLGHRQPATVLAWHRRGFQLYWRWKSRRRPGGRPPIAHELRNLIRRMASENPPGAGVGFMPNSTSSAMRWPSSRSRGTCADDHRDPPPRGAPS
jgi:putative transposase